MPQIDVFWIWRTSVALQLQFAKSKDDEPIWRSYPAAVSSLFLSSGQLSIDGRTASNGTDVSFQLKHS
jgi:hypothetical protein